MFPHALLQWEDFAPGNALQVSFSGIVNCDNGKSAGESIRFAAGFGRGSASSVQGANERRNPTGTQEGRRTFPFTRRAVRYHWPALARFRLRLLHIRCRAACPFQKAPGEIQLWIPRVLSTTPLAGHLAETARAARRDRRTRPSLEQEASRDLLSLSCQGRAELLRLSLDAFEFQHPCPSR